jgi:hypothetical protein
VKPNNIVLGGNTDGKNDANRYLADLQKADAKGITTLIISADAFFQDTRNKLIKAANDWIELRRPGERHVCYPLADYKNEKGSHKPKGGASSWYGPSLRDAYYALGVVAGLALEATAPMPFARTSDDWGTFS